MTDLTNHGAALQGALSQRYGVSPDAVRCLMDAVSRGAGYQAQFSHPELGGMGQWSSGGMTMVGDMFNTGLQHLVASLCGEIANAYAQGSFYLPPPQYAGMAMQMSGGTWWPAELGHPSASGAQNNLSYAIFPDTRRLAVNLNGQITVYDTGNHQIGGISQQQSGGASWTFSSQFGPVDLASLPVVSGNSPAAPAYAPAFDPQPVMADPYAAPFAPQNPAPQPAPAQTGNPDQIFAALEKLAALYQMGVLTEPEFAAKKAELLARL